LQKVQESAAAEGLFFPLDLAARGSATVGGLIANNAGGTRVIRFGMMREHVLGLEAVLADGNVLTSLNKMLKNNAGYDLKHLLVGTEGTLGVITRAVLRLWPALPSASTALVSMERFEQVISLLALARSRLSGQLSSYEVLWKEFYRLTTTPPAASSAPLRQDSAYYVLIEALGADRSEDQPRFERLLDLGYQQGLISEAVMAQSSGQRAALWRIREDSDQIEARFSPTFGFDISLPIQSMESYIAGARLNLERAFGQVKIWVYGHAGDGNLHMNVWGQAIAETERQALEEIIYRPLPSLGGSISAEHGIGLDKKPYLALTRTAQEIAVMQRIKAALDPSGILNPGKIFDTISV
jgi:FAD/FMN-containing dehydrogenase